MNDPKRIDAPRLPFSATDSDARILRAMKAVGMNNSMPLWGALKQLENEIRHDTEAMLSAATVSETEPLPRDATVPGAFDEALAMTALAVAPAQDTPRTDALLAQIQVAECLPGCDSYGHEELCCYAFPENKAAELARTLEAELYAANAQLAESVPEHHWLAEKQRADELQRRYNEALVDVIEQHERQIAAARAQALEEALNCYSPDDTAVDRAYKIRALAAKGAT